MGKVRNTAGMIAASAVGVIAGSLINRATQPPDSSSVLTLPPGDVQREPLPVQVVARPATSEAAASDIDRAVVPVVQVAADPPPADPQDHGLPQDHDVPPTRDRSQEDGPSPDDAPAWDDQESSDRQRTPDPDVATAVATALAQGRRDGRRELVRSIAGGTSAMAIGALITLLALSLTGAPSGQDAGLGPRTVVTPPATQSSQQDEVAEGGALPADPGSDPTDVPAARSSETPGSASSGPFRQQEPDPVSIGIPSISVDADVIPLQVLGGVLQVPGDFAQTGWWEQGPEPGETGPSVVVGHVDSASGPAVFFRLRELRYDDEIVVTRADGSTIIFAVRSSAYVDKEAFPTELVYGETDGSELRLITCDGDFSDGSYLGNLIIFAERVGQTEPLPNVT